MEASSPSSHEGVTAKADLHGSFDKFIGGRKTTADWDTVHEWASGEDMSHYFPDGVPHVADEFSDYTPSNAEEARHEARKPCS